ncbi:MAG TPA: SDR family oxidoreductase [Candidatus Omnitrophota bacterium]|nr:SDR family oxidoreductase [Candidatus Omnitrophota bacterium]HPD85422.1 SDR family oxidoreductase [Candidatus Omnitrophota bacterium]HRZ04077.1 SDR family oxidoreductase [Candidatus Omnitrophota bacterium]
MNLPRTSKVILITGCSSGFGLLTAARLAAKGHIVFATMRNLEKSQALLGEAQKRNATLRLLQLDVTDNLSIQKAVSAIEQEFNHIDVLINNAGYGIGGFFEDLSEEDIRRQMETNFFGAQNVTRQVIPAMRRQGEGKIINITSVAGLYGLPGFGAYNASKWALEGFSESLYYELKLFGIKVCLVEPGTYRTKIFDENRRYAANYNNPNSPYYHYSQHLKQRVDEHVKASRRDPEDIAILIERLVNSSNPPFRNIPDLKSKITYTLRHFLPFRVFSGILYKGMLLGMKKPKTVSPSN